MKNSHLPVSIVARRFLLALVVLAAVPPQTLAQVPSGSPAVLVDNNVRTTIQHHGVASVIVELRLPMGYSPEGELSSSAAVSNQRADIAATQTTVLRRLARVSHRVIHRYRSVPFIALEVGRDALIELEASPFDVQRVIADSLLAPGLIETVPLVQADQMWAQGADGTGTVIAIVDTGVDRTHPFLAGKVVAEACFSGGTGATSLCPNGAASQIGTGAGVNCTLPGCYHGTHVAGIAAGNGGPAGQPFSGVARGAQLISIQVFSRFDDPLVCEGSPPCALAFTSNIIAALDHVHTNLRAQFNVAAVNMSLGGGAFTTNCDTDPIKTPIDNLRAAGIPTIVAAGNSALTNALSAPACVSSAISVGATDNFDQRAPFSNIASFLSLYAPGTFVVSSVPFLFAPTGYATLSGTSMAAPHVAGAWAILKQVAPTRSVTEILTALQQSGQPVTASGITRPRIRIAAARELLRQPDIRFVTTNLVFPPCEVGSVCRSPITIFNDGDGLLRVTSIRGTAPFGLDNIAGDMLVPAGGVGNFNLTFAPATAGTHVGTITVISNDPDEGTVVLNITGTATGSAPPTSAPDIRFATNNLQFGSCQVGTTCRSPISVFNDGNAPLHISSIRGTPPFSLDNIPGLLIVQPGQQGDFNLTFTPGTTGVINGTITVISDDPDESTVVLNITGTGTPGPTPDIRFVTNNLQFGSCPVGSTCRSPISIFNDGNATLRVFSIQGTGPFSLDNIPGELVVQPGQQGDFNLTFTPLSTGVHNGTITVVSNDPDESPVVLNITGTAIAASQVRFLNNLVICNPNCSAFTARLTASEGYTWFSTSRVYSPYQAVTTPTLSNFVAEAVGYGSTVSFPGVFNVVSGQRYALIGTLNASNSIVLLLVPEGSIGAAAPLEAGRPAATLLGEPRGDAAIRFGPATEGAVP